MLIEPFLKLMHERGASDLFLTPGAAPHLKIDGTVESTALAPLDHPQIHRLASDMMSSEQVRQFEAEREMNFGLRLDAIGNFRINLFVSRGQTALVIRRVPTRIPSLAELNLPPILNELARTRRGLIFVVGATGCGKSTTVASMLERRNRTQPGHILTIEEPIEFLFEHGLSLVNQREVGVDTDSYGTALRNAMREAPDLLMIGEVRDADTLMHALNYAQSGHLCITTLHANNSYHMLNRIISFFPHEARQALLYDMSVTLRAVISQRLVLGLDGKLLPAVEILQNGSHIAELIRQGDIDKIKDAIDNSMAEGSQTFEQSLHQLYRDQRISLQEALSHADSASNLYWLINQSGNGTPTPETAFSHKKDTPPPASFDILLER